MDRNLFLDRIFDLFDEDKNGVIDFDEFVRFFSVLHPSTHMDQKIDCNPFQFLYSSITSFGSSSQFSVLDDRSCI